MKTNPQTRPAETAAGLSGLALLVAHFAGIRDPSALTAIGAVIAAVPSVVTAVVEARKKRQK